MGLIESNKHGSNPPCLIDIDQVPGDTVTFYEDYEQLIIVCSFSSS